MPMLVAGIGIGIGIVAAPGNGKARGAGGGQLPSPMPSFCSLDCVGQRRKEGSMKQPALVPGRKDTSCFFL